MNYDKRIKSLQTSKITIDKKGGVAPPVGETMKLWNPWEFFFSPNCISLPVLYGLKSMSENALNALAAAGSKQVAFESLLRQTG